MTPEEQLAKILKQNQNIVFGKTIGTDADGNCTVQTGESSILARSGGQVSAGDCVAMKADDGQWYAVSSRQTGTVDKKTLFKRKAKPLAVQTGVIKALYYLDRQYYVGGDRSPAELIYTFPDGYDVVGGNFVSTGDGEDEWILDVLSQKTGVEYPDTWEIFNLEVVLPSESFFATSCYLTENSWFISTIPQGIGQGYRDIKGRPCILSGGSLSETNYYVRNPKIGNYYGEPAQRYLRFQLSVTLTGAISTFPMSSFNESLYNDRYVLATITADDTIEVKDSGIRVTDYAIAGTPVKNVIYFTPEATGYGWWSVEASQLSHWYLGGGIHSRWNGVKANFKLQADVPIGITVYSAPTNIPVYQEVTVGTVPDNSEGQNGDFRIEAYGGFSIRTFYKKVGGVWEVQPYSIYIEASARICQSIPYAIDENVELTTNIVGNKIDYVYTSDVGSAGGQTLYAYGFMDVVNKSRFYGHFPLVQGGVTVNVDNYIADLGFDPTLVGSAYSYPPVAIDEGVIRLYKRGLTEHLVLEAPQTVRYYQANAFTYIASAFYSRIQDGYLSKGLMLSITYSVDDTPKMAAYSITDIAIDGSDPKELILLDPQIDASGGIHYLVTLDEFNAL